MTKQLAIIGIDALDYEELDNATGFDALKQAEYGKVDNTPALLTGKAVSPTMWTSFMTGQTPDVHGIRGFTWDFPCSEWLYKIPTPNRGWGKYLETMLNLFGRGNKDFPPADKIQSTTFIDQLGEDCVTVNAPLYEFSFSRKGDRLEALARPQESVTHQQLLEDLRRHSELVFEDVKQALTGKTRWDVFFSYFYWLDGIQHRFFNQRDVIETEYGRAAFYVAQIKERLPDDTTVIVVSDHGADGEGGHRNEYGFWSCNKEGVVPEDAAITDFYDIIMEHAGLPGRDDEAQTKQKLEALGYV